MIAKTHKSKKAKGRRLELKVASLIREAGLDKNASRMPLSGAFWALPGDIKTNLPLTIECKNTERHRIWKEWEEAVNRNCPSNDPVLVISGNNRPILAVIDINFLLILLRAAFGIANENKKKKY